MDTEDSVHMYMYMLSELLSTPPQCDLQLPDGLIAQVVENCTGVAEVMGSNPVQA